MINIKFDLVHKKWLVGFIQKIEDIDIVKRKNQNVIL